jgi:ferredoxin
MRAAGKNGKGCDEHDEREETDRSKEGCCQEDAGEENCREEGSEEEGIREEGRPASAGKKIATAKRALQPVSVPNIDYSLCQGCGGCSEAFPHLFEMRGELAWVINPEQFDAERDAGILTICPYYAISIEKI